MWFLNCLCLVLEKNTWERALCRVLYLWHSAKSSLPSVKNKKKTRQRASSPSVFFYRWFFVWHPTKIFLPSTRKKHSAKNLTLGKEPNSSSDGGLVGAAAVCSCAHEEREGRNRPGFNRRKAKIADKDQVHSVKKQYTHLSTFFFNKIMVLYSGRILIF
jgi:hypothetical protein